MSTICPKCGCGERGDCMCPGVVIGVDLAAGPDSTVTMRIEKMPDGTHRAFALDDKTDLREVIGEYVEAAGRAVFDESDVRRALAAPPKRLGEQALERWAQHRPPVCLSEYRVRIMMPTRKDWREVDNDEAERALRVAELVMHDELRGLLQLAFEQAELVGYTISIETIEDGSASS